MANPSKPPENQVIVVSAKQYWVDHPNKLMRLLQNIVRGHEEDFEPEWSDKQKRYQLDSGDNWWVWLNGREVNLESRYMRSATPEQWTALRLFLKWRLNEPPQNYTPCNEVISGTADAYWFAGPEPCYMLIYRIMDLVRGRKIPKPFDPVFVDGQWKLNPDGHWWLRINKEKMTWCLDLIDKSSLTESQWNSLGIVLEWRLNKRRRDKPK